MSNSKSTSKMMRVLHRYIGFFLAGIMAVYAISGIILIFRTTDFLKQDKQVQRVIEPNLNNEQLGRNLRLRDVKVEKTDGDMVYFNVGTYNKKTGEANYTVKELPMVLDKLTHLHKATTNEPLFFLNILFGLCLLFFVISSFWMFMPSTKVFKKGLYFTFGGIALVLIMLFI